MRVLLVRFVIFNVLVALKIIIIIIIKVYMRPTAGLAPRSHRKGN